MQIKPCTAFANNSPVKQLNHVEQELTEVKDAFNEWQFRAVTPAEKEKALHHLGEELVDLQVTCETMMLCCGFDGHIRNQLRVEVTQKNWERGYYDTPKKST
jgi:hypothetical protein